jgi:hypothetical protein
MGEANTYSMGSDWGTGAGGCGGGEAPDGSGWIGFWGNSGDYLWLEHWEGFLDFLGFGGLVVAARKVSPNRALMYIK